MSKLRTLRVIVLCALFLASLGAGAGVVEAKSVKCDLAGNCKTYCTQTVANGSYIEYEEGTVITVTTTDGKETKNKCQNGEWVQQARTSPGAGIIGTISPNYIGPIQIKTVEVDEGWDDGKLIIRRPQVLPCGPNQVSC